MREPTRITDQAIVVLLSKNGGYGLAERGSFVCAVGVVVVVVTVSVGEVGHPLYDGQTEHLAISTVRLELFSAEQVSNYGVVEGGKKTGFTEREVLLRGHFYGFVVRVA